MENQVIGRILDNGEIGAGMEILDISAGRLVPWYVQAGAAGVTALNPSRQAAEALCRRPEVQVLSGDVEKLEFGRKFDRIVVFDTLADYPNPKRLVRRLAGLLNDGGRLTVAQDAPWTPEQGIPSAEELVKVFDPHFTVEIMVSTGKMYQVSGVKRDPLADVHCGVTHTHGGMTHTHSHGEIAHEHTPRADAAPIQELLVLMRYLVSHNDAHAQEVAELAAQLQSAGKAVAYDEIMDAVADFDMVNAKLDAILAQLTVEES